MKRALISVSDKTGVVDFAKKLSGLGYQIISTGGTLKTLQDEGLSPISVSEVTGFPECLGGRVKTLHPKVHGGILAKRSDPEHMQQLKTLEIDTIDMVVVNLYPFKETILKGCDLSGAIENIDIGGPTMLRSAAKNYKDVTVLADFADYDKIIQELSQNGEISEATNLYLAQKVFAHTAAYDALIADYLGNVTGLSGFNDKLTLTYEKVYDMRYGENPHQQAAFYKEIKASNGMLTDINQLHGKELSFNNINDTHGALELLKEFESPAVVACKHSNPCGAAVADNIYNAYVKAYNSDPVSIFGGIVCCNREVDKETALEMSKIFIEIILAPSFSSDALEVLKQKKNLRVLTLDGLGNKQPESAIDFKKVSGGLVAQQVDSKLLDMDSLEYVTDRKPDEKEMHDLLFAWKVVKYVKSNGICLAKGGQVIGIGPGQVNRIWAAKQAIEHGQEFFGPGGTEGSVMASDAFFPFPDCVEEAYRAGVTAIIQPGGSIKDKASIELCNQYGIAMVFTGIRHFRH
jgi:phosphoribosylaminoimidazolecarboxamide formyltransferase/IMP cyclohydrolase